MTMEMIGVEKQDMIRGAARAEVRTVGPLCGAGWWWGTETSVLWQDGLWGGHRWEGRKK